MQQRRNENNPGINKRVGDLGIDCQAGAGGLDTGNWFSESGIEPVISQLSTITSSHWFYIEI